MFRSALRILSLVAVLALLVAGVVILTQEPGSAEEAAPAAVPAVADASASAVLAGAAQRDATALTHQVQSAQEVQRRATAAKAAAAKRAAVTAALKARAEAKARATRDALRNPQGIAKIMVLERGWSASQFSCLRSLWQRESGWSLRADNPTSSAYGIPQALPGSRMASAGPDWRTNPVTQITWGLKYVADRYGTPCGAWAHSESHGWY